MKNRIEQLQERVQTLQNIVGELDTESTNQSYTKLEQDRFKTLMKAIEFLQKKIMDIGSYPVKEANNKYEEIAPLLDSEIVNMKEMLKDEEMKQLIASNEDDLQTFLQTLEFIKKNQKYLQLNPILDADEKIKTINGLELKSMTLESKMAKMNDNVDNLLQNYNQTIDIINKKFALYNDLLDNKKP